MKNNKYKILLIIILILIFIISLLIILYKLFKNYVKNNYKNKLTIDNEILNSKNNYYNYNDLSTKKLVILTCHYNENLFWLKKIDYPFIISSKKVSEKTLFIPYNKGNEASCYLRYIIKYYESLPEFTLFVHGHYIDWHQLEPLDVIINNIKFDKEYKNINSIGIDDRRGCRRSFKFEDFRRVWKEIFEEELLEIKDNFYDKCCAQFLVHRDRIRLRSKEFYIRIENYIIKNDKEGHEGKVGYYLEYIWHYIFGERNIKNYKNKLRIVDYSFY
jgi:hypothetical protein